jgi:hypothetical protein
MKIYGENPNWVKVGQKYWAIYMKTCVHFVVTDRINLLKALLCNTVFMLLTLACSSVIHLVHCCFYIATVVRRTRHSVTSHVARLPVLFPLYVVTTSDNVSDKRHRSECNDVLKTVLSRVLIVYTGFRKFDVSLTGAICNMS